MKKNLRSVIVSLLILFSGISITVFSQVLMYDNFNYTAGTQLTANNWIQQQTTATNPVLVAASGLTYPGYICSGIGNAAAIGPEGQDVFRGFVKQTLGGTRLYLVFLVKVTAGGTGDCFISLKESATSATNAIFRGRVYAKTDGSNNVSFGISKGAITAPATANYTPAVYSLNTTYLLVMKYSINDGIDNDTAMLFVNPVIGNPEPAPNVICQDFTASEVGLGSVLLRQGTAGSSPTVTVDGVRVAKSWNTALTVSNIATLSDLKVDGVTVANFNPETIAYNDTVPAGQTSVAVISTTTDWAATQVVTVATAIPGISNIVVTAENGTTTKTYTVTHAYNYFPVTVAGAPAAWGTVSGDGVYPQGFQATVTAVPGANYSFFNWTENGAPVSGSATYTFTVEQPRNLVANFLEIMYLANAVAIPAAGGTINGTGFFAAGSTVSLTAVPNTGYIFQNWSENGTILGTNPVYTFTNLQANHTLDANFIQSANTFTVTAVADPPAGGVVTGSGNFSAGSSDTLRAVANVDYKFQKWTENGTTIGTDPELILSNIQANHTITAQFTSTVGIPENPAPKVVICPNPATSLLKIESTHKIFNINVFDITGRQIYSELCDSNTCSLNVSSWLRGIVFLEISTAGGRFTQKAIIR
jgi:hypothetical protein